MHVCFLFVFLPTLCLSHMHCRWQHNSETNEWIGVFAEKVWVLKQENDELLYRVYECEESYGHKEKKLKTSKDNEYNSLLSNYFRLNVEISDYYKEWSAKDPYFKAAAEQFYGVRILNQDVVENIFSFICSSNNNIKRYLFRIFM